MSESIKISPRKLTDEEYFASGHTACAGCGGAITVRLAMKALGKETIAYVPACCLIVFGATYPLNAWKVPFLHVAFENSAAVTSGISRAQKVLGKKTNVVVFAGDGGTADIGFQALSGAAERNENILYIMYDNAAYMNTGIQASSQTPMGASTTTTPPGKVIRAKREHKKDVPRILAGHDIPYVAMTSVGDWKDLYKKVAYAKDIVGMKYIQVDAPCPTGWRYPTGDTIKIAQLAIDTGYVILGEWVNGEFRFTGKSKKFYEGKAERMPVEEYLKPQGRFRHLFRDEKGKEDIKKIQEWVDRRWRLYSKLADMGSF